jgi:hypothetical protein
MDDRRAKQRRRTFLGGTILQENGARLSDCIVRDVSDSGAQVSTHQAELPGDIVLEVAKTRRRAKAKVMWSSKGHHGLMYKDGPHDLLRSSPSELMSLPKVQAALYEAKLAIAAVAGVPVEAVSLTLDIVDPPAEVARSPAALG